MPSHSFRLSFDVLVTDRDRPNALATPGKVEVDIEADDRQQACQKLGDFMSQQARRQRSPERSHPDLYVIDAAVG